MNCEDYFEKFYQYLDRDLDTATWQQIELHFKFCRSCWDRVEFEKKLKERLSKSCCKEICPETLEKRIKALLEKY